MILVLLACLSANAQGTRKTPSVSKKAFGCSSGTFSFKCPKDYKILIPGSSGDRLFFAKSKSYDYAVFVASESDDNSMAELLPKIIRALLPNDSQKFEWKDVDADTRKSSKFEVESKRKLGSNGKSLITLEYRRVEFDGKKLLTGTVVNGFDRGDEVSQSFEKGSITTNGGCFDSVDIIAAFTKEKLDPLKGPCYFAITMSPGL